MDGVLDTLLAELRSIKALELTYGFKKVSVILNIYSELFIFVSVKLSYVYILLCSDQSYYTGVTSNLDKRLEEHSSGKYFGSYTHSRRPVELVYYAEFTDINIAIEHEKKIKKWSRAKKLTLIKGRYDDLPNLAKKKF